MDQAARRQILGDMGIDVWCLRAAPGAAAAEPATPSAAGPAAGPAAGQSGARGVEPAGAADAVSMLEALVQPAAPAAPVEPAPAAAAPAGVSADDTPSTSPWAAISLSRPGLVLVVEGDSSRRDLRLAMDILAAATGDWRQRPARRRFDWPPAVSAPAVHGDAGAGRRAFGAFLEKDLADHQARVLACVEPLAAQLGELPGGADRLVIPALAELGRDAAAKRALWEKLADLLR